MVKVLKQERQVARTGADNKVLWEEVCVSTETSPEKYLNQENRYSMPSDSVPCIDQQ